MLCMEREAGAMAMVVWMCPLVQGPQGWPQGYEEPQGAARLQVLKLARAGLLGQTHVLVFLRLKEEERLWFPRRRRQNCSPNLTICQC